MRDSHSGDAETVHELVARGNALRAAGRSAEALASYDAVIALAPDCAEAHNNRGVALGDLGQWHDALASHDEAIALDSKYIAAHKNRGVTLQMLGRNEEALASYRETSRLDPTDDEAWCRCGLVLIRLGRHRESLTCFERALALDPQSALAHNGRGNALRALKQFEDALKSYDAAIAARAAYAEAHNNRGATLDALGRRAEALASVDRAIALKPDLAEAHANRGNILTDLSRSEEALASYKRARALKPDLPFLLGNIVRTKAAICDWTDWKSDMAELVERIRRREPVSPPVVALLSDSPELNKIGADVYDRATSPAGLALPDIAKRPRSVRIRVGYFACDFHDHATCALMAELFERHDRTRFELTAFSLGPRIEDAVRKRIRAAFDRFIDVRDWQDVNIVQLARKMEIDIAVDLHGYWLPDRHGIFKARAAPIQVNFLAYPGTMGAGFMDYIVADTTVIPEADRKFFGEKVVYLPDTYQPNDSTRPISDHPFTRAEMGLPERAFVFCCFNNNYKIAPETFDIWMRILKRVDGSVLWLIGGEPAIAKNLQREAESRGIAAARIIFAKRVAQRDHLARHRLADLFLDTLPYNAHTTTSDSLWAGLPVITRPSRAFPGRVAASLLKAIGLPELITATPEEYENLAVELAIDPEKLSAIKRKLATNRLTTPLYDARRFAANLEAAYSTMYERYRAGLPPDHFWVAPQTRAP